MTVLALCVIRGNSNFTQYRSVHFETTECIFHSLKIQWHLHYIVRHSRQNMFHGITDLFILAINESFSACLSLSISRSSFLRLSAASRLCLSSLNCSCAN